MPAVIRLGSDRCQNPRRFAGLDNANDGISFGLFEISIDELIPPTFRLLQDRRSPLLRSILHPIVKLRGDVAQDTLARA